MLQFVMIATAAGIITSGSAIEDLTTIRVTCQRPNCGLTVEYKLDQHSAPLRAQNCPFCQNPITTTVAGRPVSAISQIADALNALHVLAKDVKVEFPIAMPDH
jgi:Zn finger protein HypA/HybF involved in hydrogenase expression